MPHKHTLQYVGLGQLNHAVCAHPGCLAILFLESEGLVDSHVMVGTTTEKQTEEVTLSASTQRAGNQHHEVKRNARHLQA